MEQLSVKSLVIFLIFLPIAYWTYVGLKAWKSRPNSPIDEPEINSLNEDQKVDFSSIPAAPGTTPPKPVDFSGNYIQHAHEALDEDLENLGLTKKENTSEIKKDS